MKIRTRALIVVMVVVSVIGTAALLVAWSVAARGLERRENLEVHAALQRGSEALAVLTDQLERTSRDWSVWDDMYRFAQDQNVEFANANLFPGALKTIGMDFMVIISPSGKIIRVVSVDATANAASPKEPPYLRAVAVARRAGLQRRGDAGVLATPGGPVLVSVQPILRSDESGPRAGTLVMGRRLGTVDAELITRVTGDTVSLLETSTVDATLQSLPEWSDLASRLGGVVVPRDRDAISGYRQIQGIDGQPGLVLGTTEPRTTMILARETGGYLLVAMGVLGLALIVGVMSSVDLIVTRRVERLSESVRTIADGNDFGQRVHAGGTDEISALGADINTMLGTLQDSQIELEYVAGHDMLTTLYNRRRFEEELERDLTEQTRTGGRGAILWLDIDEFKEVNDTLGHAVGDRLLAQFSRLMKDETRAYATLARIGGDEFALILPNADRAEAEKTASRLISLLASHVFEIDGHRISQEVSIGIALYPDHGRTKDDLFVSADLAMYEAKKSGGSTYRVSDGSGLGD